jgi:hypothetical protein
VLTHYAHEAKKHGDYQLGVLFHSFGEDAAWHKAWSMHLLELILKQDAANKEVVSTWLVRWINELVPAVHALQELFFEDFDAICKDVFTNYEHELNQAQIDIKVIWC